MQRMRSYSPYSLSHFLYRAWVTYRVQTQYNDFIHTLKKHLRLELDELFRKWKRERKYTSNMFYSRISCA